ncbi:MAG: tetratricopeptide repeat protein [Planctomycetota bacterium]
MPAPPLAEPTRMLSLPTNDAVLPPEFGVSDVEVPEAIYDTPGMIFPGERTLLYRLAKEHYTGQGAIVDAGMFMGASTVCFGHGLRNNPRAAEIAEQAKAFKPIQGYELGTFPAPPGREGETRSLGNATYQLGVPFVDKIQQNVAPYNDLVETHIGDLHDFTWDRGRPIEICFIDVAKTASLNQHVFEQFFPAFIPGVTLVVQQDYYFDRLPWIKVLQGFLADHFESLGQVGPTGLFRCTSAIPADKLAVDPYGMLPGDEQLACHNRASLTPPLERRRFSMNLSELYLAAEKVSPAAGIERLKAISTKYADLLDEIEPSGDEGPLTALGRIERAIRLIAQEYKAAGKKQEAIEFVEAAIELFPEYAKLHHRLGLLVTATGDHDKAIAAYRKALEIKPDFKPAQEALHRAIEKKKQREAEGQSPAKPSPKPSSGSGSGSALKPVRVGLRRRLGLLKDALTGIERPSPTFRKGGTRKPSSS